MDVRYWPKGDIKIKFDWVTMLLITLLIATLFAFFTGLFSYPYGWIIFTIMLIFRLTTNGKKE